VGALFKRYTHLVLGLSMKLMKNEADARDMVMQVFEKLLIELKTAEIDYFKGWLCTVARNTCLMELRKRKSAHSKEEEYKISAGASMEYEPLWHLDIEASQNGQLESLNNAIAELQDDQRTCIELFYLKKLSYAQVAEQTGFTLKQVKSFLQNGKRKLKIIMEK
jgi:RNA polymerase sigma factor (sigma-70 family)